MVRNHWENCLLLLILSPPPAEALIHPQRVHTHTHTSASQTLCAMLYKIYSRKPWSWNKHVQAICLLPDSLFCLILQLICVSISFNRALLLRASAPQMGSSSIFLIDCHLRQKQHLRVMLGKHLIVSKFVMRVSRTNKKYGNIVHLRGFLLPHVKERDGDGTKLLNSLISQAIASAYYYYI